MDGGVDITMSVGGGRGDEEGQRQMWMQSGAVVSVCWSTERIHGERSPRLMVSRALTNPPCESLNVLTVDERLLGEQIFAEDAFITRRIRVAVQLCSTSVYSEL